MTQSIDNSQSLLYVDKQQAQKQLEVLGYKEGDRVSYRYFAPKGKGTKGKAENFSVSFPTVPNKQDSTRGLYVVVNGPGQRDDQITQCRAVFFEHDDRPIDEQIFIWREIGLPEPSLQIQTRKSVHTYFAFIEAISPEEWRELQQDLLEWTEGDRTLKNPSRVMRLAGAWHIKSGEEPIRCDIIHEGPKYSYEEIRAIVPRRSEKPETTHVSTGRVIEFKPRLNEVGSIDLVDLLNREILPRLQPTQIYNWPGHEWQEDSEKYRGFCPWHKSESGTAFHIEPNGSGGEWLWHCPSCDIGGGAVAYRDRLRGGNGSPKGKEWVDVVRELATEAGVAMPEKPKPSKSHQANDQKPEEIVPLAKNFLDLQSLVGDRLRLNQLTKDLEFDGEAINQQDLEVMLALKHNAQFKYFEQISAALAKENTYSPVVDYLNEVAVRHGDDTSIIDGMAQRYFGRPEPIFQVFLRKWLVSAVARAFEPGCKMDTALILQGAQGAGKSSFFKCLAGQWFDDSVGDIGDKDERLKLHRAWIVEWSELETVFRRKDLSSVKAFLSCSVDNVRPPYGRSVEAMKRQGVIVGTTNEIEFLNDPTGNRRFWIIPISSTIDLEVLRSERDRIWAAAVALYRSGESWWLSREDAAQAEIINEQFKSRDPWEEAIAQWLHEHPSSVITISEVFAANCVSIEVGRQTKGDERRVGTILRELGYEKKDRIINGRRQRVWVLSDQSRISPTYPHISEPPYAGLYAGVQTLTNQASEASPTYSHISKQVKTKNLDEELLIFDEAEGDRSADQSVQKKISEFGANYMRDDVGLTSNAIPAKVESPTDTPAYRDSDMCGTAKACVGLTPGMVVKRRDKPSWFGELTAIEGDRAKVRWHLEKYDSDINAALLIPKQ